MLCCCVLPSVDCLDNVIVVFSGGVKLTNDLE